jgi:hypothetical protein
MATVWVTQDSPGKNLLPAKDHGTLKVLLTPADVAKGPKHMGQKLQRQLTDIQPYDAVLLIGDPIAIGLTMHVALHNTHGIVNVLRWDRQTYEYEKILAEIVI